MKDHQQEYVFLGITIFLIAMAAITVVTMSRYNMVTQRPPAPRPGGGDGGVICTMDAKICPDGSGVGRIGPNCEFAACPGPSKY